MADLVMGAMGNLIPKLYQLLKDEYKLQKGVKERITVLTQELEHAQAALRKVAEVPWDQLDEEVQLWSRELREASYNMEDVLDTFLVRVQGPADAAKQEKSLLKQRLKKMTNFIKTAKARHKVSGDVKDIMVHLQEVTDRCRRYKVDDIAPRTAGTASTVDPRLHAMYNKVKDLVGIDESSSELISMLQQDEVSDRNNWIVSIVGVGGLGKTTVAKAVYDKLKADFDCRAFVPVGRNPDLKKVFKDILIDLDRERYKQFSTAEMDERNLIDELRSFLENKRYFIVIDDIWDMQSWEIIKLAFDAEKSHGGRIIITTRHKEIATIADGVYKLQPLDYRISRKLLFTRIGPEAKYANNKPDEISDKFISKCGGIPLAIITMASLLAGKQREEWPNLYKSIDFGSKDNKDAEITKKILSFSYYDLPSHLRACLLYLSAFQEDSFIPKESLVWMWAAEGFVREKNGIRLFEIGEGYFNDLINRSMIQPVDSNYDHDTIIGCRVHDMVLDFIRAMSKEENFCAVLDSNDQGTVPQSNLRRLSNHNKTIGLPHQASHSEMAKLRSFVALGCAIEAWAPLSNFKHLRVLAVENCKPMDGSCVHVEHIGYLLHLRFLSLKGTRIDKIPEGIGALNFLQTLDLWQSYILELPLTSSLPNQLACLRITFDHNAPDAGVYLGERLTSLEDLSIEVPGLETMRWFLKGSLRELRMLHVIFHDGKSKETDLVDALGHLQRLESLSVQNHGRLSLGPWQGMELVLPCHLRHLAVVHDIVFFRLPPCINPLRLPNLSHLELLLKHMDEQDLKILGGLPELRYLCLELDLSSSSPAISNITDSNGCYFPKLRCCRLKGSMVIFVANKEDKSVSFHIWNGRNNIFHDRGRPLRGSKLQHGLAALALALAYLLAFLQHVVVFIKKWSLKQVGQHPFISSGGSGPKNAQDPKIAMHSVSKKMKKKKKKKGSVRSNAAAAAPPPPPKFMPSLQVLRFDVPEWAVTRNPNLWDNLSWEYLSSLREISVGISVWDSKSREYEIERMQAALRRAAQVHPNRPALRIKEHW